MKGIQKCSLILAVVLLLTATSMMTMAEADAFSMEAQDTATLLPSGFTVSGTNNGAVWCTDTVYGNSTGKLKIEHTTNVTTVLEFPVDLVGNYNDKAAVTVEMVLASLEEGEGLKAEWIWDISGSKYDTEYFKTPASDEKYNYWRTAMVWSLSKKNAEAMTLRITFSGKGTAYLDNIDVCATPYYLNGDLEAVAGDGIPAAWTYFSPMRQEHEGVVLFAESADNNYYRLTHRNTGFSQTILKANVTEGAQYRVTASYRDGGTGKGLGFGGGGCAKIPCGDTKNSDSTFTSLATTWADRTCTYYVTTSTSSFMASLVGIKGTTTACEVDNIRIAQVSETCMVTDATGAVAENNVLPRGEVTLRYEKPVTDFVKTEAVLTAAGIVGTAADVHNTLSTSKVAGLIALYEETESGMLLTSVQLQADARGRICLPASEYCSPTTESDIGILPITVTGTVTVPSSGKFVAKVMTWNDITSLQPLRETYTYTTAPEA